MIFIDLRTTRCCQQHVQKQRFLSTIASRSFDDDIRCHMVPSSQATRIASQERASLLRSSSPSSSAATKAIKDEKLKAGNEQVLHHKQQSLSSRQDVGCFLRSALFEASRNQTIGDDFREDTSDGTISFADVYLEVDDNNWPFDEKQDQEKSNRVPIKNLESTEMALLDPQADNKELVVSDKSPALALAYSESMYATQQSLFSTEAVMEALETFSTNDRPVGTDICRWYDELLTVYNQNEQVVLSPSHNRNVLSGKSGETANDGASRKALRPTANPDSLSLVNTATTTTTTLCGTPIPRFIYVLPGSMVPLDEPLEMPDEVRTEHSDEKKTAFFIRLRVKMQRLACSNHHNYQTTYNEKNVYLTEFDNEAYERTLVQI